MNRPTKFLLLGAHFLLLQYRTEAATLTVTNTADSGPDSFRQAILNANASVGVTDTIAFDIPPSDPGHLFYRDDGVAGQVTPASVAVTSEANDSNIADIDPDWPHSWYSIRPQSLLPEITDSVSIDGYTQAGAAENTNPVGQGLNSVLRIEIDGTDTQDLIFHRLRFGFVRFVTGENVVRGLALNRVDGPKIWLESPFGVPGNSRLEGNYLGPDVSGSLALLPVDSTETSAAHVGVHINGSPGNLIGGTSLLARNLISANNGSDAIGVSLSSFGATNNLIQGNLIGTDRSGMRALSTTQTGVRIGGVPDNLIGGLDPGAQNVISGNQVGVDVVGIFGPGNVLEGNIIGADVEGLHRLGNQQGVSIGSVSTRVQENTIAFNGAGVHIGGGTANLITKNSIFENDGLGIDLASVFNTNDIPPESDPPDQDTGPNNLQNYPVLDSVTLSGSGTTVEGLLQSTPNSSFRIEFFANVDRDPSNFGEGQTFLGELEIDTDTAGNAPINVVLPSLPAGQSFVTATATDITIRPPRTTPANDTSEFSRAEPLGGCSFTVTNSGDSGLGSLRNAIVCAAIAPGSQTIDFAIPPDDPGHLYYRNDGVAGQVTSASVATTTAADDAGITDIDPDWPHSWFSIRPSSDLPGIGDTVFIDGYSQPGSSWNTVPAAGGLDTVLKIEIDGTNGTSHGLRMGLHPEVFPSGHRIEGVAVNRWPGNGIVLDSFGSCTIVGCFIGTDVSGTVPLGNGDNGIYLSNESNSSLGGRDPEDRNLISANFSDGVEIALFSSGTNVHGNLIGTDRVGSPILPNGETGVLIHASSQNRIGGIEPGASNFIAFGSGGGVVVQSSTKGVSKAFLTRKGDNDMECECRCECLGGEFLCGSNDCFAFGDGDSCNPDDPHTCRCDCKTTGSDDEDCEDCGILNLGCHCSLAAAKTRENPITQNSIADALPIAKSQPKGPPLPGIDLGGDGVTLNDGDNPLTPEVDPDSDEGPNGLQNYPVLTSAVPGEQSITIGGILESTPEATFRIEFYSSPRCHPSGHGPSERFLGFTMVTTDESGLADILEVLPEIVAPGEFVTSTATRLEPNTDRGETSEFSACIQVQGEIGPCPTPFPDFNNDNVADALDLIELFKSAANGDGVRDLTEDGATDDRDFLKFSLNWQTMDCSK